VAAAAAETEEEEEEEGGKGRGGRKDWGGVERDDLSARAHGYT